MKVYRDSLLNMKQSWSLLLGRRTTQGVPLAVYPCYLFCFVGILGDQKIQKLPTFGDVPQVPGYVGIGFFFIHAISPEKSPISLIWPPCNSEHQDYYMFSRGFLLTFTFHCYREGAISNPFLSFWKKFYSILQLLFWSCCNR